MVKSTQIHEEVLIQIEKKEVGMMAKCSSCQTEVSRKQRFCPNCGKENPIQRLSAGKKMGVGVAGMLVAILLVGYFFIFTQAKTYEKFKRALEEENIQALQQLLVTSENQKETFDKESLHFFIQYVKQDKEYQKDLFAYLKEGKNAAAFKNDFNIQSTGRTFGMFPDYRVVVQPYTITIHSNVKNVPVYINEQKVGTLKEKNKKKTFGPLLPGEYTVTAEQEEKYSVIRDKKTLVFLGDKKKKETVFLQLKGEKVAITSNDEDATLYMNGTSTKKTIGDLLELESVSTNGTVIVQGVREYPWGEVKSKKVPITSKTVYIDVPVIGAAKEREMVKTIHQFTEEWAEVYTNLNTTYFTLVSDNYKKNADERIALMRKDDERWEGEIKEVIVDKDSIKPTVTDDTLLADVNATFIYESDTYDLGSSPMLETTEDSWLLHMRYDSKKESWMIDSIENGPNQETYTNPDIKRMQK